MLTSTQFFDAEKIDADLGLGREGGANLRQMGHGGGRLAPPPPCL